MKKLYRSQKQKVFVGVCGGLGEYFDIDPVLIRLLFVIALLSGGVGLIAYIVFWIAVPQNYAPTRNIRSDSENGFQIVDEQYESTEIEEIDPTRKQKTNRVLGIFFILFGGIILLAELIPDFGFKFASSIIYIAIGIFLLTSNMKRS